MATIGEIEREKKQEELSKALNLLTQYGYLHAVHELSKSFPVEATREKDGCEFVYHCPNCNMILLGHELRGMNYNCEMCGQKILHRKEVKGISYTFRG